MTVAVLALVSNLGDRLGNLRRAVLALEGVVSIRAVSSLYEVDSVGGPARIRSLHAALLVDTELSPDDLWKRLSEIEQSAGGMNDLDWGPRTLGIELVSDGRNSESTRLSAQGADGVDRALLADAVAEVAPDRMLGEDTPTLEPTGGGASSVHRWNGDWRTEQPSLGTLGVALVSTQFLLFLVFAVVAVATADVTPAPWRVAVGLTIAGFGGLLVAGAFFALGAQLSALPDPRPGARLVQGNVFALVRHPIYGGLLLAGMGTAITLTSSWSILPLAALAALFRYKSEMEERALTLAHPEYSSYRIRVPRRFIPIFW